MSRSRPSSQMWSRAWIGDALKGLDQLLLDLAQIDSRSGRSGRSSEKNRRGGRTAIKKANELYQDTVRRRVPRSLEWERSVRHLV